VFLAGFVCLTSCGTDLERLAMDLFEKNAYVPYVYPGGNVTVAMGLVVVRLNYDQTTQVLRSNVWERFMWTDHRLRWQPEEYGGISVIRVPSTKIWKPDIELYNGLESVERHDVNVVIFNDGSVMWIPPAVYRTTCATNSSTSQQICHFKFGSWTYDGFVLDLQISSESSEFFDFSSYIAEPNNIKVVNYTAIRQTKTYTCCSEPYIDISANITIAPR